MVAAYEQQHFVSIETPSAYVPPQPRSHANRVGLYSDELVAAPNPRVGEEARVVAVLDATAEVECGPVPLLLSDVAGPETIVEVECGPVSSALDRQRRWWI
jgi:hypothetical protein